MDTPRPAATQIALPKKHHATVMRTIDRWVDCGVIDRETSQRLSGSISVSVFDWQRAARYAFLIAIACIITAVSAVFADKALVELLKRIFDAPAAAKCVFFGTLSVGIFGYAVRSSRRQPHRLYGNESIFFLGVLALAAAMAYLGVAVDTGSGHYALLFLLASCLYALLGLWFPSALVWVFGLLALGAWMGTETGYVSGGGMYFLGMNYPLRFVIFGGSLTMLGIAGQHGSVSTAGSTFMARLLSMCAQTKVVGLLNLFIGLWIMSIFGNYGDMSQWQQVRQFELFHWAVLFGVASIAAMGYGLKHDDGVLRGFGLTFLCINLYTRYFEYFWNTTNKAIFFAVLAVSFWYLGSRAEAIWQLGQRRVDSTGKS